MNEAMFVAINLYDFRFEAKGKTNMDSLFSAKFFIEKRLFEIHKC